MVTTLTNAGRATTHRAINPDGCGADVGPQGLEISPGNDSPEHGIFVAAKSFHEEGIQEITIPGAPEGKNIIYIRHYSNGKIQLVWLSWMWERLVELKSQEPLLTRANTASTLNREWCLTEDAKFSGKYIYEIWHYAPTLMNIECRPTAHSGPLYILFPQGIAQRPADKLDVQKTEIRAAVAEEQAKHQIIWTRQLRIRLYEVRYGASVGATSNAKPLGYPDTAEKVSKEWDIKITASAVENNLRLLLRSMKPPSAPQEPPQI